MAKAGDGVEAEGRSGVRPGSGVLARRSELAITETEESAIAAAAIIGESNKPVKG